MPKERSSCGSARHRMPWEGTPGGGIPGGGGQPNVPHHGMPWGGGPHNVPLGMPWAGMPRGGIPGGGGQHNARDRMQWGWGQPDARQLMAAIKSCRGLGDLARILHEQRGALDHIHVSAAWVCLARIGAGRGGGDVREVVAVLQDRTWDVMDHAGGRELANMVHSRSKLSKLGVWVDQRLRLAMQRRATATAGEFTPQGVANLLWALATMGERADRGLLEAMQGRATATAREFTPQNVSNVLWALTVMGKSLDRSLGVLFYCFSSRVLEIRDLVSVENKSQLHQWLLSCDLDMVSGASFPSGVARVKQELGEECLQAFSEGTTHESGLQREVVAALRRTWSEVEFDEEYRDARSGYSIDVLVRRRSAAGSTEWAVEVDGPTHFLRDGRTPSGSTLLKRRQLGQLGYTVVPVPFWEWDALRGEEAKRRYLQDNLRGK